ncbi:hypothetical protein B0T11DRAFT_332422 [Plectosphaerella cucumerina]|uniref:Uncharacterized protein n=1 Tax=Plectosphaerella cucumerina TaxID=40658 RepID=A0A8K0T6H9_9PEZI|nr:hypothetical protein B0T11DRAFT_332422 [Plectosphaerella cucumerina]
MVGSLSWMSEESDQEMKNGQPSSPAKSKSARKSKRSRKSSKTSQNIYLNTSIAGSPPMYPTSPQSTTELLGEQSYLMSNLPSQHRRSAGYQQRLADLEAKLKAGEVPKDKVKKTKKDMYSLRKGITETSEQRNTILGRLGEIYVEMQNRQHWTQAISPSAPFADWFQVSSPMTPWSDSFWSPIDVPPTPVMSPILNAQTPEFIPMGWYGYPMAAQPEWCGPEGDGRPYSPCDYSPASDRWEDDDATASQPSKSDFDGVDYSFREAAPSYCPDDEEPLRSPYNRRLSVPCLKSPWPTDDDMSDPFETYMDTVGCHDDDEGEEVEIILDRRGQ